jgi:hypothetical protein
MHGGVIQIWAIRISLTISPYMHVFNLTGERWRSMRRRR